MSAVSIGDLGLGQRFARRAEVLGKSIYDHPPGVTVLSSGLAYPPCLPDVVHEAANAVSEHVASSLQYGPLMGLPDLREAITAFVREDGVKIGVDNVLVTYGAKNALDLACRVYLEPGDRMIVTTPSYMTALQIMRTHGVTFVGVGQDDEGLDVAELEEKLKRLEANGERMPKLLFDIPDFHNPTGITMSLARREALIELAKRYNFIILEDDPYRRIRFEGEPIPPLKALDDAGVVIALGTVSKILAPGLRLGWAIGEPEIIRRMAMQKADGGCNPMAQRIVVDLMRSNKMQNHIDELTAEMRLHRDAMIEAFSEHLPDAKIRTPNGGYFLWAEMPDGVDAERVTELGVEHGVEVSTGRLCFAEDGPNNFLRMAYSFVSADKIREGISQLGAAYRQYQAEA
ncbi:MAG: PLP-dependent aminotransferase family protein [Pseudomonadota bacterium]